MRNDWKQQALSKVPAVTLGFWIIKIAATTLGETGADTVTMTLNWGYLAGTALFLAILATLVIAQIRARKFHPFLYWATIVASTTFGTTMADFADRSLGIGYTGGSTLLFVCLMATPLNRPLLSEPPARFGGFFVRGQFSSSPSSSALPSAVSFR